MRLVTFTSAGQERQPRLGALLSEQQRVVDLQAANQAIRGQVSPLLSEMIALIAAGRGSLDLAGELVHVVVEQSSHDVSFPLDHVTLQAPVPRPPTLRDCLAFEQHLIQAMRTVVRWRSRPLAALDAWLARRWGRGFLRVPAVWHERPIYYKGNPHSVVGPETDVIWPAYEAKLDFELEFGVFIGRGGRDIPVKQAREHIAGYTIFNDFSARETQLREMQGRLGPAKGKDFDTGNVLGPWLVTPDEVPDPYALRMEARVNGETWSSGTSADMRFTFEEMIAYISQSETLYPGDFIGSGTVPGGCGLELDRWLEPGDVVELEVEQLGILRNRVVRE